MTSKQKQIKLRLNTLKDMEETMLRLKIKQDHLLALKLLCVYRPGASLRQLKNSIKGLSL